MDEEKKKLLVDLYIQLTPWAAKEIGENKLPVWAELASKVHPNCSFMTAQNTFKKLMKQEKKFGGKKQLLQEGQMKTFLIWLYRIWKILLV
jgi:hypothetical protein